MAQVACDSARLRLRGQRLGHIDGKTGQQLRRGLLASFELTVDDVALAVQGQYGDLLKCWVNDPVLGDAGLGVFLDASSANRDGGLRLPS